MDLLTTKKNKTKKKKNPDWTAYTEPEQIWHTKMVCYPDKSSLLLYSTITSNALQIIIDLANL